MRVPRKQKVHVITMGCAKNVVDSERLMAQLRGASVQIVPTIEAADVAVINTCGFIEAAREESIDMIISQVKRKGRGRLKKVYAMGCLTERYREDLTRAIPELDAVFGSRQLGDILEELGAELKHELLGERLLTTPSHTAYLKISEGCDNPCSFCSIPLMRGNHVSVPMPDVLAEANLLAKGGVRELVVIGQDTTFYGLDLYGKRRLSELLGALGDVNGIEWVRLMYAYPAKFPLEILDVIADHPHLCKYIDLPLQHCSDPVLKSMRRGISARAIRTLLETIRRRVPDIAIRTTLIIGYPGETDREFDELLAFVREERFHRLGVFLYSREEGTSAYPLEDPVPQRVKEERQAAIMTAQQAISLERNEALVGTVQRVLIDSIEGGVAVGRTASDAPEIDNEVTVEGNPSPEPGKFYDVEIVDASEYDMHGVPRGIP